MCGIFAAFQDTHLPFSSLLGIGKILQHRGPDDEGYLISNPFTSDCVVYGGPASPSNVFQSELPWAPKLTLPIQGSVAPFNLAMLHRRLSIVDISPNGHQPMACHDQRYWVTYNGEIYNYLELRNELVKLGYSFYTSTDTEVLVYSYIEWGVSCLDRLDGMWAFAIYDCLSGSLFVARDRFGIKPLYVFESNHGVYFSSEIKAFTLLDSWHASVNESKLLEYLIWNLTDTDTETLFAGVSSVQPGSYLLISLRDRAVESNSVFGTSRLWYSLPERLKSHQNSSSSVEFIDLLENSVAFHMRSDTEVGSCLSGGLDSSSLVCLANEYLGNRNGSRLHTFTARSHDDEYDEYMYASKVIDNVDAIAHVVYPGSAKLLESLDQIIWHQDEPFVSTSIFAQWCVFKLAHQNGIKVILDGQGADEILGGYTGFFGAYLSSLIRQGLLIEWIRQSRALSQSFGFSMFKSIGYSVAYLSPILLRFAGYFDNRSYSSLGWLSSYSIDRFPPEVSTRVFGRRPSSVREMSLQMIASTHLPMLLRWEDRNSMAHSVESRVPFLDHRLVEYCLALPDNAKISDGWTKRKLRESLRGHVPCSILDRRDKMGFATAEQRWFDRDNPRQFREMFYEAFSVLEKYLSPTILNSFERFLAGSAPYDRRYWRIICAARWSQIFSIPL